MSYNQHTLPAKEASWRFAFSQRLNQVFEHKGIVKSQFIRKSGITKSLLDNYLNGKTIPNYFHMMILAENLDIPIEELVDLRIDADMMYYDNCDD